MADFTIEELAAMIIAPEPNIEDYHENGAYDSASFHEAYGVWETRIKFARQMLDLIAERNRLTAETRALQAKIKSALWVEGYYHEGSEFGDYERGRAEGWEAARREYRKRLSED